MAARKKRALTPEEQLEAAFVPEQECPYEIPTNWCWVKAGSLATIHRGVSYKKPDAHNNQSDNCVLILRGGNIEEGTIETEADNIYVDKSLVAPNQYIRKGDIVIVASTGSTKVIGRAGISDRDYTDVAFGAFLMLVRPTNMIQQKYLGYYFQSMYYRDRIRQLAAGVNINNIRADYITDMPIALPPLHEQRRIASRIEWLFAKLDDAEAELREVIDSSKQRQAAILHKAFTGELVSLGDDNERSRLHVPIRKVVSGLKYGTSEKSTYDNEGMPVLRIPNVSSLHVDLNDMKYLAHSDVKPADMLQKGDILMIRSNGSRDLVGRCAVVPTLEEEYTYASFLIRIRPSDRVDSKYLWYYLQSTDAKAQLFTKAKSSSGIHNINSKEIGATIMPLPAMDKQHAIVQALDALFDSERDVLSTATIALDRIRMTRESVLNKALRGELGTNDPSEASSKELLASIMSGNADK